MGAFAEERQQLYENIKAFAPANEQEAVDKEVILHALREHRGMSLLRRIKAVFWWCCMHCEYRVGAVETLKIMPPDDDIAAIYRSLDAQGELAGAIPEWGDAIMWGELHMTDYSHQTFRHDWDYPSPRFVL